MYMCLALVCNSWLWCLKHSVVAYYAGCNDTGCLQACHSCSGNWVDWVDERRVAATPCAAGPVKINKKTVTTACAATPRKQTWRQQGWHLLLVHSLHSRRAGCVCSVLYSRASGCKSPKAWVRVQQKTGIRAKNGCWQTAFEPAAWYFSSHLLLLLGCQRHFSIYAS